MVEASRVEKKKGLAVSCLLVNTVHAIVSVNDTQDKEKPCVLFYNCERKGS